VYFDTARGFVVAREDSPHHMGDGWEGARPVCPMCSEPSTRIVTLAADQLPFDLAADPSFFWFSCDCDALDSIYVELTATGPVGLMVPMADRVPTQPIVPDGASLLLERHPNQYGYGVEITSGFALHQVGGYTPWRELDRHPRCLRCSKGMRFIGAFDSGPTPLGAMGFHALLYGFWCDEDAVSCTMSQADLY
jgi:hypothetical protein